MFVDQVMSVLSYSLKFELEYNIVFPCTLLSDIALYMDLRAFIQNAKTTGCFLFNLIHQGFLEK